MNTAEKRFTGLWFGAAWRSGSALTDGQIDQYDRASLLGLFVVVSPIVVVSPPTDGWRFDAASPVFGFQSELPVFSFTTESPVFNFR